MGGVGPTAEFGIESYKPCQNYMYVQKTARRYCIFMQYFTAKVNASHLLARFEPSKLSWLTMLGSSQKEQAREKAQRLVASVLATRSPDKAIDTAMLFDSGVDAALKVKQLSLIHI